MTPLQTLITEEKKAHIFGFDWPNYEMIFAQMIDEIREVKEDIDNNALPHKVQEEIGDVLHVAISLCVYAGFDVEETLAMVHNKFSKRMSRVEELTKQRGLPNLKGQSMEFMLELWREAKKMESKDENNKL
jgi:uncharacterized protein YabN with tetrapyrrole methylase and pyrophosphatase domain